MYHLCLHSCKSVTGQLNTHEQLGTHEKELIIKQKDFSYNSAGNIIYIYIQLLFGPVKPELGVIPSGQENYSKVNIYIFLVK